MNQASSFFRGVLLIVTFIASTFALAQSTPAPSTPPVMGGEKGKGKGLGFLQTLDLSPEQMEKLLAIRTEERGQMEKHKEEVKKERTLLQEAMKSSASSNEMLSAQFQKLQASKNKLAENRFSSMLKMREILTPAQREKARDHFAEHFAGRGPHGKKHHRPGHEELDDNDF